MILKRKTIILIQEIMRIHNKNHMLPLIFMCTFKETIKKETTTIKSIFRIELKKNTQNKVKISS